LFVPARFRRRLKMLRLAIQGPLGKGDDMEESQLRVSSAIGEDDYVE
jgi:hypothetical protein